MRITLKMQADTTLHNLRVSAERLDRLQTELASGYKISAPSDDPAGAAASLELKDTLGEIEQYMRNVDAANSWLGATDSALDSVTQVMQRARELAVRGASDTLSADDKKAVAAEIAQLLEQTLSIGNSTYAGQHLFGGFQVDKPPFSPSGDPSAGVSYDGDGGRINRQIDSQSTVTVNVSGDAAFSKALSVLIALRKDLDEGKSSEVGARLSEVDDALNSILALRSEVGARQNRLERHKETLESLKTNATKLLSETQDVDLAEAITDFSTQQNAYQAALAAGAKVIQPSLLDYLR